MKKNKTMIPGKGRPYPIPCSPIRMTDGEPIIYSGKTYECRTLYIEDYTRQKEMEINVHHLFQMEAK